MHAYRYFVSFVLLGQFIMLNLFVAVILENFEYEMGAESDTRKVKRQDLDSFATAWSEVHLEVADLLQRQRRLRAVARRTGQAAAMLSSLNSGGDRLAPSIADAKSQPARPMRRSTLLGRGLSLAKLITRTRRRKADMPTRSKLERQWLPAERLRDVMLKLEPPLGLNSAKR